jgi:hypothetical protein
MEYPARKHEPLRRFGYFPYPAVQLLDGFVDFADAVGVIISVNIAAYGIAVAS